MPVHQRIQLQTTLEQVISKLLMDTNDKKRRRSKSKPIPKERLPKQQFDDGEELSKYTLRERVIAYISSTRKRGRQNAKLLQRGKQHIALSAQVTDSIEEILGSPSTTNRVSM